MVACGTDRTADEEVVKAAVGTDDKTDIVVKLFSGLEEVGTREVSRDLITLDDDMIVPGADDKMTSVEGK